jgi:hypothetical protein
MEILVVGCTEFCEKVVGLFAAFEVAALYHTRVPLEPSKRRLLLTRVPCQDRNRFRRRQMGLIHLIQ